MDFSMNHLCFRIICAAVLSGVLMLQSCKEPAPTFIPISSQSLRDAMNMKANSYFIFRDSATGRLDSFVASEPSKVVALWGYDNTNNEQISYDLYGPEGAPIEQISVVANRSWIGIALSGTHALSGVAVLDPFSINATVHWTGDVDDYARAIRYSPSLNIEGIGYQDVYETESFNTSTPGRRMQTWFSAKSGLIMFRYEDAGFKASATLVRFG